MSKPFFTKRHFEFIANTIKEITSDKMVDVDIARYIADKLQNTNPLFKRDVFLKACGVGGDKDTNGS